jgi:hypothetical protein
MINFEQQLIDIYLKAIKFKSINFLLNKYSDENGELGKMNELDAFTYKRVKNFSRYIPRYSDCLNYVNSLCPNPNPNPNPDYNYDHIQLKSPRSKKGNLTSKSLPFRAKVFNGFISQSKGYIVNSEHPFEWTKLNNGHINWNKFENLAKSYKSDDNYHTKNELREKVTASSTPTLYEMINSIPGTNRSLQINIDKNNFITYTAYSDETNQITANTFDEIKRLSRIW